MRRFFLSIFCFFGKIILSLRYSIKIQGKEILKSPSLKKGGILFLPNHPALIDPVFIMLILWPRFKIHPIAVEYIYRQKGIQFFMKLTKAIAIPNLDTSINELKIRKTEEVIHKIGLGLKKKRNYLLYPAGRLKLTGKEILGGASATHSILQEHPNTSLVLIRTSGLWGSSFSRAYEGRSPDMKKVILQNVKKCLKNGIFFMPRRKIHMEIALAPKEVLEKKQRLEINRSLENWYNQYPYEGKIVDSEPLVQVSYSFWKKDFLKFLEKTETKKHMIRKFSSKTEEKVYQELSRKFPDRDIEESMDLALDLGMDSLDKAELVSFLSVQFDVKNIHPEEIQTVRDILEIAEGKKKTEASIEDFAFFWPEEGHREEPEILEGKTIPEVFLKQCERMKGNIACSDDLVGVLSYRKFKLASILLAKEIRKLPGKNIGILLPATAGTYLTIMATWLAKKTPVMLNWTLGPRYLNHMMELTQLETVISSWRFLERISNVDFGQLIDKVKFLEDLKGSISTTKKLSGLFSSLKKPRKLLKEWDLSDKENDIAVILFTSGTEANPKGVPLSHKNILFDLRESLKKVKMYSTDVLYGMLPPFHSFGFTVTGIFPLIAGIKATFTPDPTDSLYLAKGIHHWKATILCSAPSFLRAIIQVAKPEELQSVRLFVTGAEKISQELVDKIKKIGKDKTIIEGYGITECAPILTLKEEVPFAAGVGKLLDGIDFCTVHPETKELLDEGKEGEICVMGNNVFSGYLGVQKSPFIEINGKTWYCTGDLGYRDQHGNIILSGRLKRFAKIGGEMVSLGGLEEVLFQKLAKEGNEGPALAVIAIEKGIEKAHLVLFSTFPVKVEEVNAILKDFGFSRLVKISEIKQIEKLPVLGTGKTDYRSLQRNAAGDV